MTFVAKDKDKMRSRAGSAAACSPSAAAAAAAAAVGLSGGFGLSTSSAPLSVRGQRSRHRRRSGGRRGTQHSNFASTGDAGVCNLHKVTNGFVSIDADRFNQLLRHEPIAHHYHVDDEPFARYPPPLLPHNLLDL